MQQIYLLKFHIKFKNSFSLNGKWKHFMSSVIGSNIIIDNFLLIYKKYKKTIMHVLFGK